MNTIFNPQDRPVSDLPVIYGFNNGGARGWMDAVLLAQDGTYLGSHICSDEYFMPSDLGILEGHRPDRHETFRQHYPDGYRMEFVPGEEVKVHEKLQAAFKLNQAMAIVEESS